MTRKIKATCAYCGRALLHESARSVLARTRDHVVPKHLGGQRTVECCYACNQMKGDMTPEQWETFRLDTPNWTAWYHITSFRGVRLFDYALSVRVSQEPPTDR